MLLATLLLLASQAGEEARGPRQRPVPQTCLAVIPSLPGQERPWRRRFSASQIVDLNLTTILRRGLVGPHVLELKIYTPGGHLYDTLTVPFTSPEEARTRDDFHKTRARRVPGYPAPLEEQVATPTRSPWGWGWRVGALFPVGGTSIATSSLYGRWRVVPHLDQGPRPCGQAHHFFITE